MGSFPHIVCVSVLSCSVISNSLQPHGLEPARLLCPWNFPGKNTGVGCHFLLQGIFPIQGLDRHVLCLLHWQVDSLPLRHLRRLGFPGGSMVKNPPAIQEMWVSSLGQEDPLEKEMVAHPVFLPRKSNGERRLVG